MANTLRKYLTRLNVEELKYVRDFIEALIKQKTKKKPLDDEEQLFLNEIVMVLQRNRKIIRTVKYIKGKPNIVGFDYYEFEKAFMAVQNFIETHFGKIQKPKRIKLYNILAESAFQYLQETQSEEALYKRMLEFLNELENKSYDGKIVLDKRDLKNMKKLIWKRKSTLGIGIKAMLKILQQPELVIENSFPGYLKSGVISWVLKQ